MLQLKLKQKLINPFIMWLIVVLGVLVAFKFIPSGFVFQSNSALMILLAAAILLWLYFFIGAILVNRHAIASVSGVEKIATEGVYGIVRHPIYFADIILAWSLFLFYPVYAMIASVVWATFILLIWAKLEEIHLEKKFKDQYGNYRKQVSMFVPKIGKKK